MMMTNRRHNKGFGRQKMKEKEKKAKKKEKEEEKKLIREREENSSSLSSKDEAHSTQNILATSVKRKSADYDEDKKDEDKTTTRITTTTTTSANTNTTRNCRICMCEESRSMPFVQLGCTCKGAMAFAHKVLKRFFSSQYLPFWFSSLSLFPAVCADNGIQNHSSYNLLNYRNARNRGSFHSRKEKRKG